MSTSQIEFRVASLEDMDKMKDFFMEGHYSSGDPMVVELVKRKFWTLNDFNELFASFVDEDALQYGLSTIATVNGKVVGAFVNFPIYTKAVEAKFIVPDDHPSKPMSQVLSYLHTQVNPNVYPSSRPGCAWAILSVSSEFRRKGIAQKLCELAHEAAKNYGCSFIKLITSSKFSNRLFKEKLGFEEIADIAYKDICFQNAHVFEDIEVHTHAAFLLKIL